MGAIKRFRTMYGDRFCIGRCNDQVVGLASKNVSKGMALEISDLKGKIETILDSEVWFYSSLYPVWYVF